MWTKVDFEKAKASWDALNCLTNPVSGMSTCIGSELYLRSIRPALLYSAAALPMELPKKVEIFQHATAWRILHTYSHMHIFSMYQALSFSKIPMYISMCMVQLAACSPVELYREALNIQLEGQLLWGCRLLSAPQLFDMSDEFGRLCITAAASGSSRGNKPVLKQLDEFKLLLHSKLAEREIKWQTGELLAKQRPPKPLALANNTLIALVPDASDGLMEPDLWCSAKLYMQLTQVSMTAAVDERELTVYRLRPLEFLCSVHRYMHIGFLFSMPCFLPLDTTPPDTSVVLLTTQLAQSTCACLPRVHQRRPGR